MKAAFRDGLVAGLPIGAGYFAVAFSLGIVARAAGLGPVQGFFSSLFTRASAGEYGAYSLMAAGASLVEVFAVCVVANLRYVLMGASLTQRFRPGMPLSKRIMASICITDEIYGITIARKGTFSTLYPLGATISAGLLWACGTFAGITAGGIMPPVVVSSLSVALYGMFIAIIIPPGKKDRAIGIAIAASFALSFLFSALPVVKEVGPGLRTVILTIVIASAAALLCPVKDMPGEERMICRENDAPGEK